MLSSPPIQTRAAARPSPALMLLCSAATGLLLLSPGCTKERPAEREPAFKPPAAKAEAPSRSAHRVRASGQLGPGAGTIVLSLEAPNEFKLNAGAPLSVEARGEHLHFGPRLSGPLDPAKLPLRLPVEVEDGALGPAWIDVSYYYCKEGPDASCRPERVTLIVDLDLSGPAAGGEAHLVYRPSVT